MAPLSNEVEEKMTIGYHHQVLERISLILD